MASAAFTFKDAMADLTTRFILNCPEEELQSFERIFFQIEQAHWFYVDFLVPEHPHLPMLKFRSFSAQMFVHCPMLSDYRHMFDDAVAQWSRYKTRVPTCGTIMLNSALDRCVLVKGWTQRSSWGFPKGKINKDEDEVDCAAREALEETGFDASGVADSGEYLELKHSEQRLRLYVVPGVPEDFPFAPRTRKEISKIAWHLVDALPGPAQGPADPSAVPRVNTQRLFMVQPFVAKLRAWIAARRRKMAAAAQGGSGGGGGGGKRGKKGGGKGKGGANHNNAVFDPSKRPVFSNGVQPSRVYAFEEGGEVSGPRWTDLVERGTGRPYQPDSDGLSSTLGSASVATFAPTQEQRLEVMRNVAKGYSTGSNDAGDFHFDCKALHRAMLPAATN